jgi:hypothetical protein
MNEELYPGSYEEIDYEAMEAEQEWKFERDHEDNG